jgi:hypothetical protein
MKLIDKTRTGSKARKVYDRRQSPCQRLPASSDLRDEAKAELTRRYQSYNPVLLQQEVHQAVQALGWNRTAGRSSCGNRPLPLLPLSITNYGKIFYYEASSLSVRFYFEALRGIAR